MLEPKPVNEYDSDIDEFVNSWCSMQMAILQFYMQSAQKADAFKQYTAKVDSLNYVRKDINMLIFFFKNTSG